MCTNVFQNYLKITSLFLLFDELIALHKLKLISPLLLINENLCDEIFLFFILQMFH